MFRLLENENAFARQKKKKKKRGKTFLLTPLATLPKVLSSLPGKRKLLIFFPISRKSREETMTYQVYNALIFQKLLIC